MTKKETIQKASNIENDDTLEGKQDPKIELIIDRRARFVNEFK